MLIVLVLLVSSVRTIARTFQALDKINAAKSNGTANGTADGHANGHVNGYTNGHTNGHTNGYTNGSAKKTV
jgi:hypothetical protein